MESVDRRNNNVTLITQLFAIIYPSPRYQHQQFCFFLVSKTHSTFDMFMATTHMIYEADLSFVEN
jgi:hypothetical protein